MNQSFVNSTALLRWSWQQVAYKLWQVIQVNKTGTEELEFNEFLCSLFLIVSTDDFVQST